MGVESGPWRSDTPSPCLRALSERAGALAKLWGEDAREQTFDFASHYSTGRGHVRGWANWLVPGRLMLGQYPHCQPGGGPSDMDAREHLSRVLSAGIDCFVCLQAELPPQDDASSWPTGGIPLAEPRARSKWPGTFRRYAAEVETISKELGVESKINFLHHPIEDLATPCSSLSFHDLLDGILAHYENGGNGIYVHCWGGRGRAGSVGACLLSLLRPDLDADAVLRLVQAAYDSRAGASKMPSGLQKSPQTEHQIEFVRKFVNAARRSNIA